MSNAEDAHRGEQEAVETVGVESQGSTEAHATGQADQPENQEGGAGIRASHQARRFAEEHDVDLSTVEGTGPEGRITIKDVRGAHNRAADTAREGPEPQAGEDAEREAAEIPWTPYLRFQETRAGVTPPSDDPAPNIIGQYDVLRAVLAGPSEIEETKVPDLVGFTPTPGKDFAPNTPLADWKPRRDWTARIDEKSPLER